MVLGVLALFLLAVLVLQGMSGGVNDPTDPNARMSHSAVVFDSGLLVFREGLESILVLAAVTASFMGANQSLRRPVAAGACDRTGRPTVATWFVVVGGDRRGSARRPRRCRRRPGCIALDRAADRAQLVLPPRLLDGLDLEPQPHPAAPDERQRPARPRRILSSASPASALHSVYREGFEVVLFLQNAAAAATDRASVARGRGPRRPSWIARRRRAHVHGPPPDARTSGMLVVTGVLIGVVLVVHGRRDACRSWQQAGWLPDDARSRSRIPGWLGTVVRDLPDGRGAGRPGARRWRFVVGSYLVAEELRYRRPKRHGEAAAMRPDSPPERVPANRAATA